MWFTAFGSFMFNKAANLKVLWDIRKKKSQFQLEWFFTIELNIFILWLFVSTALKKKHVRNLNERNISHHIAQHHMKTTLWIISFHKIFKDLCRPMLNWDMSPPMTTIKENVSKFNILFISYTKSVLYLMRNVLVPGKYNAITS